ncbi:hypothetical protein Btru_042604 [Bulinus truncatus]|nr:hypothetical protein Btru_042604 [Bulinus truncatus]
MIYIFYTAVTRVESGLRPTAVKKAVFGQRVITTVSEACMTDVKVCQTNEFLDQSQTVPLLKRVKMFAVVPRLIDDSGIFQLADEMMNNPWYMRPALADRNLANLAERLGDSEIHNTDKEFRVRMDLHYYKPEEVKITSDNKKITVHAKHEEKQDKHGFVSREMIRTYSLPEDVDPKSVTSTMNSNGVLNIKVAKKALEAPKEIPIAVEYKG